MTDANIFIIHILKNMGSTLYSVMSKPYLKKYYGRITINEYQKVNSVCLNKVECINPNYLHSIDHFHIDMLFDLGILTPSDVCKKECICVIRDPIDRFLSLASYLQWDIKKIVNQMKNGELNSRPQFPYIVTKQPWKITLFRFDDIKGIEQWFFERGKKINLTITKKNVSKQRFKITDISAEDLLSLNAIYFCDRQLYNSIPFGGILSTDMCVKIPQSITVETEPLIENLKNGDLLNS